MRLMNKIFTTAALLCCLFEGGLLKQLPEYISVCKRDPKTINECALRSIDALRPTLIKGIPELDVPGIDPFFMKELIPIAGNASPIQATGKDIKVSGAGDFTIKKLAVDLETFTIRAHVRFPKLHFDGRYKLDTQLLVPIKGEGKMTADAVKCDAEIVLHGQITEKDGAEYIEFDKLDMDIKIKDYRIKLDNLFNGDKVLGEAANQAINQNRGEFLKTLKPYAENTVSKILLDLANRIVKDLTLDQLLPKP